MQAQMIDTAPPVLAAPLPMTAAEWAARIVVRHPALDQPVEKALALVEEGHVRAAGRRAEVVGSDGKNTYHLRYIEATGAWLCTCPAFLYRPHMIDRKSTRLNSSHVKRSRMPSSA